MKTKPFAEAVIDSLRKYCVRHYDGNVRKMSEFLGIDPDSGVVARLLRTTGAGPMLGKIGPVMDKIGVTICNVENGAKEPVEPMTRAAYVQIDKSFTVVEDTASVIRALRVENARLKEERDAYKDIVVRLTKLIERNDKSITINITNNNHISK